MPKRLKPCKQLDNGTVLIPIGGRVGAGKYAIVDSADAVKVMDYNWHMDSLGYVVRTVYQGNKYVNCFLHREVLGTAKGKETDHINHNKLDNRRANLREVSRSENAMNRKAYGKTGMKGVYESKKKGLPYIAQIRVNSKTVYLGYYKTKNKAHRAWLEAARKHYGKDAILGLN